MASKKFSVVEFEDGLEVIPSKWLDAHGFCRHPGYVSSTRMKKLVKNLEPPQENWKSFKIRRIYATSNTYERGLAKLQKAEYESEGFTSTEADVRHRDESGDEMALPTYPNFPYSENFTGSTVHTVAASSHSEGFEERVTRMLSSLTLRVNSLFDNQEYIMRAIDSLKSKEDVVQEVKLPVFPLSSLQEVEQLEEEITNEAYKKALISDLKKIGGYNVNDCVRRLMNLIMTNDVAETFSFCGFKRKRSFLSLGICAVVMDVVRCHFKNASNAEMSKPIGSWLRHAKERREKKRKNDLVNNVVL